MYVCMYVCKLRHSEGPQFVAIRTALKSPLGFLEKRSDHSRAASFRSLFTRMVAV